MRKMAGVLAILLCASFVLCSCSRTEPVEQETKKVTKEEKPSAKLSKELTENEIEAVITLSDGETIEIELYPDVAPKTVANFVKNVQEGFYSGTIFHRVIEGFMIQGGGYDENYELKSVSETVEGEFEANGFENELKHTRGVISMARTKEMNSASTQFFIMHEDAPHLDGQYAAFGKVTGGMEIVDEIAETPITNDPPAGFQSDVPEIMYTIESIEIISDADDESADSETDKEYQDTPEENESEE